MVKAVVLLITFSALAACGKAESVKTAEQLKQENDKYIRDNPVWGEQVKTLDKAKETQKALDDAAAANAKNIAEITK